MRKIALLAIMASILTSFVSLAAKNDPVVITVGGEKVKLSEFEYLYKKNNAQLATDMTLDEYIDMFVNYKLKVCAALDAKLDTLSSYRKDMEMYSAELSAPYRVDKEMLDSLVNAAYSHKTEVVDVHHLMLFTQSKNRTAAQQAALADSLRGLIVAGADVEDLIEKYSEDKSAAVTKGKLAVAGGYLLYELEDAVFNTPVGGVTDVVKSRVGLHIFKIDGRRPHPGEVKARHILIDIRKLPKSKHDIAYAKADSLRNVILAGADFRAIASRYTEDPSGRFTGGDLPWFGPGRMIKEFEEAAYAMADGEVSKPVKTAFGYHLLFREGSRQVAPLDSVREDILSAIKADYRQGLVTRRTIDKYAKSSGSKINSKITNKVRKIVAECGGLNDASRSKLEALKDVAYTVDGQKYGVEEVLKMMGQKNVTDCDSAMTLFNSALEDRFVKAVEGRMLATLADREPAYGNLINEYSDGMLLYEISNRTVWDRANSDMEGLEAFYQAYKDNYKWDVPHYKGYVVFAESDSIVKQAVAYLETLPDNANYVTELRKEFGTKAKIERVVTARGSSPIVDYVAFGGALPGIDNRWVAFASFRGSILEQPESAMDVKGTVSVDYQQHLEEEWIAKLRRTYPVIITRDIIKKSLSN